MGTCAKQGSESKSQNSIREGCARARAAPQAAWALSSALRRARGCSDIYFDRREAIALGADDHITANRVSQMVEPVEAALRRQQEHRLQIATKLKAEVERSAANPAGPVHQSLSYSQQSPPAPEQPQRTHFIQRAVAPGGGPAANATRNENVNRRHEMSAAANSAAGKTHVVRVTPNCRLRGAGARETFGASDQIALRLVSGSLAAADGVLDLEGATVAVIDLDAGKPDDAASKQL